VSDLVQNMLRMNGPAKASSLANRYAHDSTACGDDEVNSQWAGGAAVIGNYMNAVERLRGSARDQGNRDSGRRTLPPTESPHQICKGLHAGRPARHAATTAKITILNNMIFKVVTTARPRTLYCALSCSSKLPASARPTRQTKSQTHPLCVVRPPPEFFQISRARRSLAVYRS
jgi:hypothetical protein